MSRSCLAAYSNHRPSEYDDHASPSRPKTHQGGRSIATWSRRSTSPLDMFPQTSGGKGEKKQEREREREGARAGEEEERGRVGVEGWAAFIRHPSPTPKDPKTKSAQGLLEILGRRNS